MGRNNRFKLILAAYIALFFLPVGFLTAQDGAEIETHLRYTVKNPEGTEFFLCFMKNFKESEKRLAESDLHLELFITSDFDAKVTVECKGIGFRRDTMVFAGTVISMMIDPLAQVRSSETIEPKHAVQITSDNPISVYGLNRRFQTTDSYIALPTRVLGKEYRAMCYNVSDVLMPLFAVVATEDDTDVIIVPNVETEKGRPADKPFMVKLNKGDVYQVVAKYKPVCSRKCDLTGSLIKANKIVAVFSGHQCAYVPDGILACNHLVEQVPPISAWGKHFYIGMLQPRSQYTYRVLANEDSTKVFEDNRLVGILKAGAYLERNSFGDIQVTADKPVLVAQYSQGYRNGDSIGDPMMLLISPTQQFLRKYRFATPVNGQWEHYVNVVVPTNSLSTMKLNRMSVDTSQFYQLGISRYSIAYIKIPFGTHVIEGREPFGLYSYGFGYGRDHYDAYGTMGGQSFFEYEPIKDTLPPMADDKFVEGGYNVIFRDDRVDDTGIREINVLENFGMKFQMPDFSQGVTQVSVPISAAIAGDAGRIIFEVFDMEWNKATFTVCYAFDLKTDKYIYYLNEGIERCLPDPGFQIGAYGKYSILFHSPDFSASGNIQANGLFSNATGTSGYGGFLISRRFFPNINGTAKLSLEKFGGTISAPDSMISHIRPYGDTALVAYREERDLSLSGLFGNLSIGGEWYFNRYVYSTFGLSFVLSFAKSVEFREKILKPEYITFPDGSRERDVQGVSSMESLKSFGLGAFIGVGGQYPITSRFSAFAEAAYTYHLFSLIDPGIWKLNQISIFAGIKMKI